MPTTFYESNVEWVFEDDCVVVQYDESSWYRRHFNGCADSKGVDFLAVKADIAWFIEVKDFTTKPPDPQKGPLWAIVTTKVRDTLAGVVAGAAHIGGDAGEHAAFRAAISAHHLRVLFYCERPTRVRRLFAGMPDAADLQDKLRRTLRAVDARVRVVDCAHPLPNAPWMTRWAPEEKNI